MGTEWETARRPATGLLTLTGLSSFVVVLALALGVMGLLAPEKALAGTYDYQVTVHGVNPNNHADKKTGVYRVQASNIDAAANKGIGDFHQQYAGYEVTSATTIRVR